MLNLRSPREIRLLRRAGLAVWRAHQAAAPLVLPGASARDIDAAIEAVLAQNGCVPLFKGVPGEKGPFPAATCVSINHEIVHGVPGDRVLRAGDIVSLDTGARRDGWCADSAYTYPVGQVAPRLLHLIDVTREALRLAIELMGRKAWWREVAREVQAYIEGEGFAVVEKFVGHGVGKEMHEEPKAPNYYHPGVKDQPDDFPLRPGVVVAIEPMVNVGTKEVKTLADGWTQVTADGKPSAHFEHTVAITANGPQVLTGPPLPGEDEFG